MMHESMRLKRDAVLGFEIIEWKDRTITSFSIQYTNFILCFIPCFIEKKNVYLCEIVLNNIVF